MYQWTRHLFALILTIWNRFNPTCAELSDILPKEEVIRGSNVVLPCTTSFGNGTPVEWRYTPVGSKDTIDIYWTGQINDDFETGYNISSNTEKGDYSLIILNSEIDDSGIYTCIDNEGQGEHRDTSLIVYDSEPVGHSNVSLSQLMICGEKIDSFRLSCNLTYKGNDAPDIRWLQVFDNGAIVEINGGTKYIGPEMALFQVVVRAEPEMNGSYFQCQTTLRRYNWTSSKVQVQYILADALRNQTELNVSQVSCQADSSGQCRFNWVSDDGREHSDTLEVSLKPSGKYICRAVCTFSNGKCTVDVFDYTIPEKTISIADVAVYVGIGVSIALAAAVIYYVLHKRKQKGASRKSEEEEYLLEGEEHKTPTPDVDDRIVRGITEMNGLLYVVFQDLPFIREIKDINTFKKERDIKDLKELVDPWDIDSCDQQNFLYIADRGNDCIWSIDPSTKKHEKVISNLRKPHKFSVTPEGQIVVPRWGKTPQIEIFESGGEKGKIISLTGNMSEPYDALIMSSRVLIVAHGHQKNREHGVCRIKLRSRKQPETQWSYPRTNNKSKNERRRINNVDEMALDPENLLLYVTDQNNHLVIILDTDGKYLNQIKVRRFPYRLCYSRAHNKLIIGHHRAISVYEREGTSKELTIHHKQTFVCQSHPLEKDSITFEPSTNPAAIWKLDKSNSIKIEKSYVIIGMTELNSRLYVIMQDQSFIRVFDCKRSFKELAPILTENKISDPWFIAACSISKCLYVSDRASKYIFKIIKPENDFEILTTEIAVGNSFKFSVTSKGQILVPDWEFGLQIYNANGLLETSVHLPDDMKEPYHAVEVENGVFIVGHGDKKSELHRICKVQMTNRKDSEELWSYGDERGNKRHQLNRPRNVLIDNNGRIFVADEGNERIIQLDQDGNCLGVERLVKPATRMFYSSSTNRVLVGGIGFIDIYSINLAQ